MAELNSRKPLMSRQHWAGASDGDLAQGEGDNPPPSVASHRGLMRLSHPKTAGKSSLLRCVRKRIACSSVATHFLHPRPHEPFSVVSLNQTIVRCGKLSHQPSACTLAGEENCIRTAHAPEAPQPVSATDSDSEGEAALP